MTPEEELIFRMIRDDIAGMKSNVAIVEKKVDTLLTFKWQIIGGSSIICFIVCATTAAFITMTINQYFKEHPSENVKLDHEVPKKIS